MKTLFALGLCLFGCMAHGQVYSYGPPTNVVWYHVRFDPDTTTTTTNIQANYTIRLATNVINSTSIKCPDCLTDRPVHEPVKLQLVTVTKIETIMWIDLDRRYRQLSVTNITKVHRFQ